MRVYLDQDFAEGELVRLSAKEWHYFKNVRRGESKVEVFNRRGQVAEAEVTEDGYVKIAKLTQASFPILPISLALGLPEKDALKRVIFSISELGLEALFLIAAERSQAAKKRLQSLEKHQKHAIEAARQCGRPKPLRLEAKSLPDLLAEESFDCKLVLDESSEAGTSSLEFKFERALIFVGCEGGWSPRERAQIEEARLRRIHLPTPILRTETAAVCAAFLGVNNFSKK